MESDRLAHWLVFGQPAPVLDADARLPAPASAHIARPHARPAWQRFSHYSIDSGRGLGRIYRQRVLQGTQTHLEFIPERTTDFIFAVLAEEFGLLGCLVLLTLYTCLIVRGLVIAGNAPTLFSRLMAGAMALIFFTYAFVNIGMVSGILPVVGVPLPLMSYGGTAMVTLGMGAGILMSIQNTKKLIQT